MNRQRRAIGRERDAPAAAWPPSCELRKGSRLWRRRRPIQAQAQIPRVGVRCCLVMAMDEMLTSRHSRHVWSMTLRMPKASNAETLVFRIVTSRMIAVTGYRAGWKGLSASGPVPVPVLTVP